MCHGGVPRRVLAADEQRTWQAQELIDGTVELVLGCLSMIFSRAELEGVVRLLEAADAAPDTTGVLATLSPERGVYRCPTCGRTIAILWDKTVLRLQPREFRALARLCRCAAETLGACPEPAAEVLVEYTLASVTPSPLN